MRRDGEIDDKELGSQISNQPFSASCFGTVVGKRLPGAEYMQALSGGLLVRTHTSTRRITITTLKSKINDLHKRDESR